MATLCARFARDAIDTKSARRRRAFVATIDDMPELPISRRSALLAAAVLLVVLVLADRLLLGAGAAQPAQMLPPPAALTTVETRLVVDVVGGVQRPGLYRLEQGARVADALARAGGLTQKADRSLVNLAAPLADGEQVIVPARVAGGAAAAGAGAPLGPAGPVHLNVATLEQLDALPGVGPVTAQKILDYRQKHGAFGSVDELDAISGIGPARLEQLREVVAP
jgi:competence protein ComEA